MMMMLPEEYALSSIPANEIAGFVIGFCMLYVVSQASKLDAIIASAQAKFSERWMDGWMDENKRNRVKSHSHESVETVKEGTTHTHTHTHTHFVQRAHAHTPNVVLNTRKRYSINRTLGEICEKHGVSI